MPTWEEARPLRTAFLVPPVPGPRRDAAAGRVAFLAAREDVDAEVVAAVPDAGFDVVVLLVEEMAERGLDPHADAAAIDAIVEAYRSDVPVVTGAGWLAEQLRALRGAGAPPVHVVAPGIDKDVFSPVAPQAAAPVAPLRVAISTADGGAGEARAAAAAMREPATVLDLDPVDPVRRAEQLARADVVLALPRVAGLAREPLEGLHRGATCVTTAVTGSDAYVEDGVNALLTAWDDERGTSRLLDLLARDRELLARLRAGAARTARAWPSHADATAALATTLKEIAGAPALT